MTLHAPANTYDVMRSVLEVTNNTSVAQANNFGGYILNNNPGNAFFGGNSVNFFGVNVAATNNAQSWGLNTVLTDNTSHVINAGTGKGLFGAELNFNVTSPNTYVRGIVLNGASISQSSDAVGIFISSLNAFTKKLPWKSAIFTEDGAAVVAFDAGASTFSGANVGSQPINFSYHDGASARHTYGIAVDTHQQLRFSNSIGAGRFLMEGPLAVAGHLGVSGPVASISSGFGTTPSIVGNDAAGRVTVGGGGASSSGVIAFADSYGVNAPACWAQDETTSNPMRATATPTQLTITGTMVAGDKITYGCTGF
jgi:hypothetical protein